MRTQTTREPRSRLVYFSHSYRARDQWLNMFFWNMLADQDLYFTVDETESDQPMVVSYIERMMARSAGFVAVIPLREQSVIGCSQYQVFEYGLAARSGLKIYRNAKRT